MGNKPTHVYQVYPELSQVWRDSRFNLDELIMWHRDFKERCPTGQLNLEDFKKMYRELCTTTGNPDDFAAHIFRLFDTDKDGYLSFYELICGVSLTSAKNPMEKIDWIFKLYDIDMDGYITKAEMLRILQDLFKMNPNPTSNLTVPLGLDELSPEKITERIFEKYDPNQDQRLSKEELLAGVKMDPILSKLLNLT